MTPELEWQTRRNRINKKLSAIDPPWKISKFRPDLKTSHLDRQAVEEYPTANGPADYALFVKGKLLGIIEAKKVGVGPQNVLEQAKRYSKGFWRLSVPMAPTPLPPPVEGGGEGRKALIGRGWS